MLLCDPMLATGSSMVLANKALLEQGTPRHIQVVNVIASEQGIRFVQQNMPAGTTVWAGAIDSELTPRPYIVPGPGDAGDLASGDRV